MEAPTDENLVKAAIEGDNEGFAELVHRTRERSSA